MTRIVVPVVLPEGLSSQVNDHFARSEYFAVVDLKKGKTVSIEFIHAAPGEGEKKAAELVAGTGAHAVLAGRIGSCMIGAFMDRNIKMFSGAEGTLGEALEAYRKGSLAEVHPNPYQI
jgi:predicted Fe-Mo cluster-binding NifX family protein